MASIILDVKIGDGLYLMSDQFQMWIEQEKESVNPKTKEPVIVRRKIAGYSNSFTDLMQSLERNEMLKIEGVESIAELAKAQKAMHEEIRKVYGAVTWKNLLKAVRCELK